MESLKRDEAYAWLAKYRELWELGNGKRSSLVSEYRDIVEPHFRADFKIDALINRKSDVLSSLLNRPPTYADNLPFDWEWRTYCVKYLADWRCAYCVKTGDMTQYRASDLNSHHVISPHRWRISQNDLFGWKDPNAGFGIEAPHQLSNLICLCVRHHEEVHEGF